MTSPPVPFEPESVQRSLLERAAVGHIAERDLRIVFVNPAALRLFGMAGAEDVIGRSVLDFVAPESHELLLRNRQARLAGTSAPDRYWIKGLRRDGTTFDLEVAPVVLDLEDQSAIGMSLRDVTAGLRSEGDLETSEARFRNLFDLAPIGIYQVQEDGTLLAANRTLATLLGYDSPEELCRVNLAEISVDRRNTPVSHAGSDGPAETGEARWLRKNGVTVWIELTRHPVRDASGRILYYEGFVRDITERRTAEENRGDLERQLSQSQKMEAVGRLAGGIAHDFNNLLTAIAGYSELLVSSLDVNDVRRTHAEEIRKAGERAAILTRQLLAFSRRQVLEPRLIDLNSVVDSMERILRRVIGEDVALVAIKSAEPCRVRADPGQIEQAILNLAVNARDAMPQGGKLTIETANVEFGATQDHGHFSMAPGHYCMVSVTDNGSGMSAEVKARLFEPFFTTKELGKGTGLGLSTTYGIVKQSGGYIWCDSETDRGTRFEIYLPRVEQPVAVTEPEPMAAVRSRNDEKLLLVEDEPEVRQLVQKLLKMQGYDVISAGSPDEALAILRHVTEPIDLMITDVVMPGMSGRQLADRLKSTHPSMKVLFVSGYTDDAIVHHGMLLPDTAFLQKPFTPGALAKKVRAILESPSTGAPSPALKRS